MSRREAPQTVLEVKEEEECVPVIAKMLRGQRVIRVDGHSGMGKSRIAKCCVTLGWVRIACNRLHGSLDDRVAFYADAARSSATRRAYISDMAAFSAWGGQVPATPETVASYLAASDALAAATLRRRLAAIADAHQAGGHPDPTKHPLVRKVFRGIHRVQGARTDAATPLDIEMLGRIVTALPEDVTALRDRALLLVGFFGSLRRSDLVL